MSFGTSQGAQKTTADLTPEQRELIGAQTQFLKGFAFPKYQETVGGAQDVLSRIAPLVESLSGNARNVAGRVGAAQELGGTAAYGTGLAGLASLFDPNYEEGQVQKALQTGREDLREQFGAQNAQFGGAGGMGGARAYLANKNLQQLGQQRQAAAAATARGIVQGQKATAAQQLAQFGQQGLAGATTAAGQQIGFAGAPQDIYSKYASVVYGIPQANTTPNFAGTQGSTQTGGSQSKGFG